MSKGYCAHMELIASDDTMLIYKYCCYNLNNDDCEQMKEKVDGMISIDRDVLPEPIIRTKKRRFSKGRVVYVDSRIPRDYSLGNMLADNKIAIENASGTWRTTVDGYDMAALKLLMKLFGEYQMTGEILEKVSWFV